MMSIIIGADIVPTESNQLYFDSGKMLSIVGEGLLSFLKNADFRIFNLECPLVDQESPIQKSGPTLRAKTSSVNGLKALGVDLLSLANNHIMDHGFDGLKSTIDILTNSKISFVGAGKNLFEAAHAKFFELNQKKMAVYACAEHEFSIAKPKEPGANPFDMLESFDSIFNLKKNCDYLIVLYHGGKEYYRYPSPMLQRICRKFIERGADLVVCQHSHCIGCEEKYMDGTIVYGQGNFIFDLHKSLITQSSLLIKIEDDFKIEYFPIEKNGFGIRLAEAEIREKILFDFYQRSELIKDVEFVEKEYMKFAKKMLNDYLLTCSGYNHKLWQKILNRLSGRRLYNFFGKKTYSSKDLLAIRNFIECEAHRELFIEGLRDR